MRLQKAVPSLHAQNRDCPGIAGTSVLCDVTTPLSRLAFGAIAARFDWRARHL